MASIRKEIREKQEYYYLEHTVRNGKNVEKKVKYLGKNIPKNIEDIKKQFLSEIYEERWVSIFKKIKKNFLKEKRKTPKTAREKEVKDFSIRFTYDTQKIEGSTLTLRETANLLEKGLTPKEKSIKDVKEAEAHEKVFYKMLSYKKDLSLSLILYWHKKLFENTKKDISGKIRKHQVKISGSKFMPPSPVEIYPLLQDFFDWYKKNKTLNAVKLAALVHLKFVTIHPFSDGNGRISRLIMNFILNKNNYPMLNITYVNRNSYYNALERSQINKKEDIFVQWFSRRYLKEFKKFLSD